MNRQIFDISLYYTEEMILAKEWLNNQVEKLFKEYKITLEEYYSLREMVKSKDKECLSLTRVLIEKLFRRPKSLKHL